MVCGVDVGIYVLPKLALEFHRHLPNTMVIVVAITTTLNPRERLATIQDDAYDLAIVPQDIGTPRAVCDFTFTQGLVAIANPRHHAPPPFEGVWIRTLGGWG
jgi:DNA-binding transcriptional LysR family regulator